MARSSDKEFIYRGGYSIPCPGIIRAPYIYIYVRGTRLRPGMYALNVRVQDTGDTISFKDQDQEYSVALHHRSRLSLNIPGVPLTSPGKRESRVTREKGWKKEKRREERKKTKRKKRNEI